MAKYHWLFPEVQTLFMNSKGVQLLLQKNYKFVLVFDCEWNNQREKDKYSC